jgi:hypothetical protein
LPENHENILNYIIELRFHLPFSIHCKKFHFHIRKL